MLRSNPTISKLIPRPKKRVSECVVNDMAAPISHRLGDVLIEQQVIKPYQLGVALDVQRRMNLPLGEILVETSIISRFRLRWALFCQKIGRRYDWRWLYAPRLSTLAHFGRTQLPPVPVLPPETQKRCKQHHK